jgi:multifunctional methyltransferase subunit TRM112
MKILTYNHLKSPVKNVNKGYPLQIVIDEMEIINTEEIEEHQLEFIKSMIPTLDWEGILLVGKQIEGFNELLPDVFEESLLNDEVFVEAMYHFLIDINIIRGKLTCPETGKEFPIEKGIANMT